MLQERTWGGRLWEQASLSVGAPLESLAGGLSTGSYVWKKAEGCFTADPEGYVEEGSGDEYLSIGSLLGNLERAPILGTVKDE
jgi:hypothetical protein